MFIMKTMPARKCLSSVCIFMKMKRAMCTCGPARCIFAFSRSHKRLHRLANCSALQRVHAAETDAFWNSIQRTKAQCVFRSPQLLTAASGVKLSSYVEFSFFLLATRSFELDMEAARRACVPQHWRFHSASLRGETFPLWNPWPRGVARPFSGSSLTRVACRAPLSIWLRLSKYKKRRRKW